MGNYPGKDLTVKYEEDILVGYRWYTTKKIDPLYAFGHGLSYTNFEYSGLKTEVVPSPDGQIIKISFQLKNSGEKDGAETSQVYVSDLESSVLRPEQELKAFQKVFLKAGETQEISMQIKASNLAFYSESTNDWVLEPGDFEIRVSSSVKDNRLKASIQIN
jgi:beta-glucosidase